MMKIMYDKESDTGKVRVDQCRPGYCVMFEGKYYIVAACSTVGAQMRGVNLETGCWISEDTKVVPVKAHVVIES
jgi:hypothetical protein